MKPSHVRIWCIAFGAVLGAVLPQVHAYPVGTAFTYQGRLVDGGNLANGLYDFEFTLYLVDFPVPMGTVVADDVEVSNGLFTADLDFGSEHFQGAGLELEIAVRPGASTGDYTILSPRQELTPVPYALYALDSAGSWDSSGNNFYTYRSVGIGTEPGVELDVVGTVRMDGFQLTDSPISGYVLTADATGIGTWQPGGTGGSSPWTDDTEGINYQAGNVGIGTPSEVGSRLNLQSDTLQTIHAHNSHGAAQTSAFYGQADSTAAHAVFAEATATTGTTFGVYGRSRSPEGFGLWGYGLAGSGDAVGVYGGTASPDGFGGYFDGKGYFSSNVGIGTTPTSSSLTVSGLVESTTGGFKFPDGTTQITAGGVGGGITLPYSNSVTSGSPALEIENLGSGEGLRGVSTSGAGAKGEATASDGYGVYGRNTAGSGNAIGGYFKTDSDDGRGVYAEAMTALSGYAGYFVGRTYFSSNVGIGTAQPGSPLTVAGVVESLTGGFKFPDGTIQTTAGGGGGGITLPYSNSVTSSSPAFEIENLGSGEGLRGVSTSGIGVEAEGSGTGVYFPALRAESTNPAGIAIFSTSESTDANAVFVNKGTGDIIKGFSAPTGGDLVFQVTNDGTTHTNVLQINGGSDLSEQFDVQGSQGKAQPGMVVCIDAANPGKLIVSSAAYDRKVAGIISGAGGVAPGMRMGQKGSVADGEHPVALTGRVYVWADASSGPIQPGDLLTTSDVPGHARKVDDYGRAQGAILGKAMTTLEEGRGLVLVLVTLQ